ncbi:MAG: hypothetical protein PVH93_07545, partial [Nitrosopumilaceae archaeon]
MFKYAILAGLLIFSFGFTSAFADESFIDPDNLVFGPSSQPYLPRMAPSVISDPLTGEPFTPDSGKNYFLYSTNQGANIKSDEKQLVQINDEEYYLVPDPQDRTANILAVLLLAVPFGLLVYRLSDEDPIPVKYAKLSGVVVAFSMLSMLSMPLSIGNSLWGYASASTNPDVNIPKPMYSLYFDDTEGFSANEALIILDQKNSALFLDGINDYITLDDSLPQKLESFTVSAWVKPDFKKGSADTFSVVSGVDSFDLSINNVGEQVAIFSIYDGIKWHSVSSHTAISEQWTHISATYSDEKIKIFVNGIQENSKNIADAYSEYFKNAESTQNIHPYLSLKSDVLVGAFNPSIREETTLENHFSGLIDDVTLYDKLLSSSQISALDESNRTPDVIQNKVQSTQTQKEETGTANEYGFITSDDNPNDQKIEEVAAEGYKVKKPEETKKKDKQNQASEKAKDALEENQSNADQNAQEIVNDSEENPNENNDVIEQSEIQEFEEDIQISTSSNSTSAESIPTTPQKTAPLSEEYVTDSDSLIKKLVRVSSDTINTFTDLPPINSKAAYEWKLFGDINGTLVDLTDDPGVSLQLLDLNYDTTLDRAEWNVYDGITEYYLVAKIILATDGLLLDSDREFIDDIFYEIKSQDDIWTYPITDGQYVRVTFEQPIDNSRDITVYARSLGSTILEVYEKDGAQLIATFDPISDAELSKVFLTGLVGSQETFDILVTGDPIEFDLIIDPIGYDKGVFNVGGSAQNQTWTTGNAGNGHNEGDWVSYQYEITGDEGDPIPSFNVVFNHYDAGQDAIFIDAFSNFRYCEDCELLPDGVNAPPKDDTSEWKTFVPIKVNKHYEPGSGSTPGVCSGLDPINDPQEFHCFSIDTTNATSELYNFNFTGGNENIIIFFQAHLSLSSTWITGHEDDMDVMGSPYEVKASPESNLTDVYGLDHYDGWTTDLEFGVGATPGSSAQFKLQDQSAGPKGAITLPIPTVESTAFASITIIKDTIPDGPIDVNFTTTNLPNATFTLDDDGINNNPYSNTTIFIGLTEGTYSVAEVLPLEGYSLTDIDCETMNPFQGNDDSPTTINLETGNATIFLENGDQVSCTFTNEETG